MRANIKGRGQSEPRGAHANQVKPNWTRWRPSTIPNAGDGLFATRKLAIHTILGVYRGESISKAEVLRRYPGGFWPYVHSPGGGIYIDAIDPQKSNHMRYINSPHGTRKSVNCTFRGMLVITTAAVRAESELFVNYGPNYFKNWAPTE